MVKELISIEMERDTLNQKWGFTIQGGADLALTAKVASVKVILEICIYRSRILFVRSYMFGFYFIFHVLIRFSIT